MSGFYIPGERLREELDRLDGTSPPEEIVDAVESVVEQVALERRLEAEAQMLEALGSLQSQVDAVQISFERRERAELQPEVDRYLRYRYRGGASLTNRGGR